MRPIEFRAWNERIKKMESVINLDWIFNEKTECRDKPDITTPLAQIRDNLILMQFTGLLDKNGRKVFEGDILGVDKYIGDVRFINGSFCIWYVNTPEDWCHEYIPCYKNTNQLDDEVIGNIYENPELLGGK